MVRFTVFLAILFMSTSLATASNERAKPQPAKFDFQRFILLSARPSDLRLFIPSHTNAQPHKVLEWESNLTTYSNHWLKKKGTIADQQLLQHLFYDVHRRYLKHYTSYSGLQSLFETGEYNCLSATALYALILDRLEYKFEIIESVNHIVLLVNLPAGQQVLLETTDPTSGFIANAAAVQQRLQAIRRSEQAAGYYQLNLKIFRSIDIRELAGLQYYNYAAWYYNQKNLPNAATELQKGQMLYQSERFEKIAKLMQ